MSQGEGGGRARDMLGPFWDAVNLRRASWFDSSLVVCLGGDPNADARRRGDEVFQGRRLVLCG